MSKFTGYAFSTNLQYVLFDQTTGEEITGRVWDAAEDAARFIMALPSETIRQRLIVMPKRTRTLDFFVDGEKL